MSILNPSARLDVPKTYKLFINGAFPRTESGRSIAVIGPRNRVIGHACQGSRKDVRDAVEAAAAAQPRWGASTAYLRGQILHRMAEMLDGRRGEFESLLRDVAAGTRPTTTAAGKRRAKKAGTPGRGASKAAADPSLQVQASVDRLVSFAGWADKFQQVLGCANPVAGPFHNFTLPEPMGVVGIVPPADVKEPTLLALVTLTAACLCVGNTAVVVAADAAMLPAALFGEVCATSDLPPGVMNLVTGGHDELLPTLAEHREVNAISAAGVRPDHAALLKAGVAENLKRVHISRIQGEQWHQSAMCEGPWMIEPLVDFKTIWHPSAV